MTKTTWTKTPITALQLRGLDGFAPINDHVLEKPVRVADCHGGDAAIVVLDARGLTVLAGAHELELPHGAACSRAIVVLSELPDEHQPIHFGMLHGLGFNYSGRAVA